MISTYIPAILIASSFTLANPLRSVADDLAIERLITQKMVSDIDFEDFGSTKIDVFAPIASSPDIKTDKIEVEIPSIDPKIPSGYLQDAENPESLPAESQDISFADITDDPSTSNARCVSEDGVGDKPEMYTRKRNLLSQTQPTICSINRPPKKKKSNATFGSVHSAEGRQTGTSPRPKIKSSNINPCPVTLPSQKISLQIVHVSCGGPIVGDFPLNPDYVLNCIPG